MAKSTPISFAKNFIETLGINGDNNLSFDTSTNHFTAKISNDYIVKTDNVSWWNNSLESQLFSLFTGGDSWHSQDNYSNKVLVMKNVGEPLEEMNSFVLQHMMKTLVKIHNVSQEKSFFSKIPVFTVNTAHDVVNVRLPKEHCLAHYFHSVIENIENSGIKLSGEAIVHRDCKMDNWVISPTGELLLVDWESARLGSPELDIATIVYSNAIYGFPTSLDDVVDLYQQCLHSEHGVSQVGDVDKDAVFYALQLKAIGGVSFAYIKKGIRGARERLEQLKPLNLFEDNKKLC